MSLTKRVLLAGLAAPFLVLLTAILHLFPATKWLGEILGLPGAWLGLLLTGSGHDLEQVIGVVLGEIVWFFCLACGLLFGFGYLSDMVRYKQRSGDE